MQVEGLGIASAAQLFTDFGYTRRDPLEFPSKKLRVRGLGSLCDHKPADTIDAISSLPAQRLSSLSLV